MKKFRMYLQQLELYEVVGAIVSTLALILFVVYGDSLDAKQGEAGWHWHPVLWIWDIYRQFIPRALGVALLLLLGIGWWKFRDLKWGIRRTLTIVRIALPFCVLLIIYRALNFYIPLFSPQDRDDWLLAVDRWLFGTQPSLWLQAYVHPHLTDYFSFVYMAWFPMIFFTLLLMLLKSREAVTGYVTSVLFAFYFGYLCYTLVPAIGPIYTLQGVYTTALDGGAVTHLQHRMVVTEDLSIPRDCFPSLHTAVSCVMLYYISVYRRRFLWLYLPLVVSILASTVYLRYHYAIDVFAGIALAACTCYFGRRWNAKWQGLRTHRRVAVLPSDVHVMQTEAAATTRTMDVESSK